MSHVITMSGLRGYMPDNVQVDDTPELAAEGAAALFDLSQVQARRLGNTGWLDLDLERDGAQYVQLIGCDCNTPEAHAEGAGD